MISRNLIATFTCYLLIASVGCVKKKDESESSPSATTGAGNTGGQSGSEDDSCTSSNHHRGKATTVVSGSAFGLSGILPNLEGLVTDAEDLISISSVALPDASLLDFINLALEELGISEDYFRVTKVESIVEGDAVRFLEFEGNFEEGYGVATTILNQIKTASGVDLFLSISEAFETELLDTRMSLLPGLSESKTVGGPHSKQWAFGQINLDTAMQKLGTATGTVKVAVIDTGVDLDHPDLQSIIIEGYDFVDNDDQADDGQGHGTHCAGIIAGQSINESNSMLGIAAKAALSNGTKAVKIMPLRVLNNQGSGNSANRDKAIRWATLNGADVISMSLGGAINFRNYRNAGYGAEFFKNDIINDAINRGVVVIAAAGNDGCPLGGTCSNFQEYLLLPCANNGVICVGASDDKDKMAGFSNYASNSTETIHRTKADVNAPGVAIYSTVPAGKYEEMQGTSMATPFVAGIAALLKSKDKAFTQSRVSHFISKSLVKPEAMMSKSKTGRIDLDLIADAYVNRASDGYQAPEREAEPVSTDGSGPGGSNNSRSAVRSCRYEK